MPVVLKIDARRRVVYSTFYGRITDEEVLRHGFTIKSDPDFKPIFSEIVDFTDVKELSISDATLARIASTPSLFRESVKHIIVATSEEGFQIATRYKELARKSRRNLIVVRTREEAYKLLGIKPD